MPLTASEATEKLMAIRGGWKTANTWKVPKAKTRKSKEVSMTESEKKDSLPINKVEDLTPTKRRTIRRAKQIEAPASPAAAAPAIAETKKTADPLPKKRGRKSVALQGEKKPSRVNRSKLTPKLKYDRSKEGQQLYIIAVKHNYRNVVSMFRDLGLKYKLDSRRYFILSRREQITEAFQSHDGFKDDIEVKKFLGMLKNAVQFKDIAALLRDFPFDTHGPLLAQVIRNFIAEAQQTKEKDYSNQPSTTDGNAKESV